MILLSWADVSSINGSIKASTFKQYNSSDSNEFSPIIFDFNKFKFKIG